MHDVQTVQKAWIWSQAKNHYYDMAVGFWLKKH